MNVGDIRKAIENMDDGDPVILGITCNSEEPPAYVGLLGVGRDESRLVVCLEVIGGDDDPDDDNWDEEEMEDDD